jgi:AcrR family transcriptional regulator
MIDTKSHILFESFKQFLSQGYSKVSINDLVKASGLSKGAFYYHFNSKEELFYEAITKFFFKNLQNIKYIPLKEQSLINNLLNHIDYKAHAYKQLRDSTGLEDINLGFFSLLFKAISMFPDFSEILHNESKIETEVIEEIFKKAINEKEIDETSNAECLAKIYTAMIDGMEFHSAVFNDLEQLHEEQRRLAVEFVKSIKRPCH